MTFQEKNISELSFNPFDKIAKEWMLITAKDGDKVNTMTASWGGLGEIWGTDVVYIFVRQSRYTKTLIDASDRFSVSFYDESERKNLAYLGSHSGRDEDKIAKVGYHVETDGDTPYFSEADMVFVCKKLSAHVLGEDGMLDPDIVPKWYSKNDEGNIHTMYIGKIEKVLVKE